MATAVPCPDAPVGPEQSVHMIMAVAQRPEVSGFCEPSKARGRWELMRSELNPR